MFQWRGPAPYFFVATPAHVDDFLHAHLGELTYGWGGIPAQVRIGATEVTTSLMPKDGAYLVPLKAALRRVEGIDDGDNVLVRLQVGRQNVVICRSKERVSHCVPRSQPAGSDRGRHSYL